MATARGNKVNLQLVGLYDDGGQGCGQERALLREKGYPFQPHHMGWFDDNFPEEGLLSFLGF